MALIRKYKEGGVSIIPEGGWKNEFDKNIGDISNYIMSDFGDNEENTINSLSRMSNDELKSYLAGKVLSTTKDYINAYDTASDKENWNKIEEAKNLITSLQNINSDNLSESDWKTVKAFSGGLGWDLDSFFYKTDEEEKAEIESKLKEQEREKAFSDYKNLGISDDNLIQTLHSIGFNKFNTGLNEEVSKLLRNKGYNYIQNKKGMTYVLDSQGNPVQQDAGLLTENFFDSNYGKMFGIKDGFFNTLDYSDKLKEFLPDFTDIGNVRRKLIVSEGLDGYDDVWGDSKEDFINNTFSTDVLGRRDYTQSLRLNRNGETITAERQADGSYLTSTGEIIKPVFSGFGEETEVIEPDGSVLFENPNLPNWEKVVAKDPERKGFWSKLLDLATNRDTYAQAYDSNYIPKSNFNIQDLSNEIAKIQADIDLASKNKTSVRSTIKNDTKKIAQKVRFLLEQGNKENATADEIRKAKEARRLYTNLNKIWATVDNTGQPLIRFKQGGQIVKLQKGDSLADLIQQNRQYNISSDASVKSGITGLREGTTTKEAMKDPAQWISTAGIAASFIPGVGLFGGLATTAADAYIGARDGWDSKDTRDLALNIGFTALGLLGLGGAGKLAVKGTRAAAKVGKAADVTSTITKATKAGNKLGKAGKQLAKPADRLAKLSKKEIKTFNSIMDDLLKGAEKLTPEQTKFVQSVKSGTKPLYTGNSAELAAKIGSDVESAFKLANTPTSRLGQLGRGISTSSNAIIKNSPKVAKLGFAGHQAFQGVAGVGNIASNISKHGLSEGLLESDIEDIRRVMRATSVAKTWRTNVLNQKSLKANTTTSDGSTTINIDGKNPIKLKSELSNPTTKIGKFTSKFGNAKSKGERGDSGLTKKQFDKLSLDLKNKLNPRDAETAIEAVKSGGFEALGYSHTPGSTITLNENPISSNLKDIKSYNKAAKVMARGTTNSFIFKRGKDVTSRQVRPSIKTETPVTNTSSNATKPVTSTASKTSKVKTKPSDSKLPLSSKSSPKAKQLANILKSEGIKPGSNENYSQFSKENKAKLEKLKYTSSEINTWIKRINTKQVKLKKGGILKLKEGDPITYNKEYNNIYKYMFPNAKEGKLPYSPISTVNNWQYNDGKYSNEYMSFVDSVDDKFYNDNIADITQFIQSQKGKHIPANARELQRLMKDGLYGPIHNWSLNKFNKNKELNSTPNLNLSQYLGNTLNPSDLLGQRMINRFGKMLNLNPKSNPEDSPDIPHTIDSPDYVDFKHKPYINTELPANLIKYAIGERGNRAMLESQTKAALTYPRLSGMGSIHLSTSLPNTLLAQQSAGETQGMGRRLSRSTSDFNAGAAYQLSANKTARDILREGIAQDAVLNRGISSEQARLDQQVDKYNTDVTNKNKAISAEALKNKYSIDSNYDMMQTHNRQTLVDAMHKYLAERPYKKEAWKYYQESMNPNFKVDSDYYKYLQSDDVLDVYKAQYENAKKEALNRSDGKYINIPTFENSEQYKAYKKLMERHLNNTNNRYYDLMNYRDRLSLMRSTILQKGGKLSYDEKVALENVKYNNRRLLNYEKEYYRNILKKAELLQKAMIKVFK